MSTSAWHGDADELRDIAMIMARNCECHGMMGMRLTVCALHQAYDEDQRFVDGLIFERRRAASRFPAAAKRVIFMEV